MFDDEQNKLNTLSSTEESEDTTRETRVFIQRFLALK